MSTQDPCVFIVDDDPAVRKALMHGLGRRGIAAEEFASAKEFLESYDSNRAGCLVLDLSMPGMDGLALQRELENRSWLIPIIFITGSGLVPQSIQALKAGAIDFLEKPFLPRTLVARIDEAFLQDKKYREELTVYQQRFASLDAQEQALLELLMRADTIHEKHAIAKQLDVSPLAIEKSLDILLDKTGTTMLSELVSVAFMIEFGTKHRASD